MSEKILQQLRYIIIIFCMAMMFLANLNNIHITYTMLGLTYMITYFLRSYPLVKERHWLFIALIIFECLLVIAMNQQSNLSHILLMSLSIADGLIYLARPYRLAMLPLMVLMLLVQLFTQAYTASNITVLGASILMLMGGLLIRNLRLERHNVTHLYDQLREQEEALISANKELALLNQTTEELTLLKERTRVSRDLHDTVGHQLSALHIQLNAVHAIIESRPELAKDMLEKNIAYSQGILSSVRETVHNLSPVIDDSTETLLYIENIVTSFEKMTGISIDFIVSKERWDLKDSHHLHAIIKESFSNALRHGKATAITLSLNYQENSLFVYIKDNGIGSKDLSQGFGLTQMKKRVAHLQGDIHLSSSENQGFTISIDLPRHPKFSTEGE